MARREKPPTENKPARHPAGKIAPEDAALWQHVVESVKPLRRARRVASAPATVPPVAGKKKPLAPPPSARSVTAPPAPPAPKGFDRATETKLKRGELDIEGRIDLHGMTQEAAYRALMRFIDRARASEKRTLLVITGKGRLSEGGGVLRRLVPQWLESGPHAGAILACTSAHAKDGGTGAYYIRLRKSRVRP